MIFDCFLYNNEKELLEIRVNEFAKCKDPVTHILVEAAYTFSGLPKPLHFESIKEEYANWPIMSVTIERFPETENAWDREKYQRNMIQGALRILNTADDAIVIISDVDEIISHKSVDEYKASDGFKALILDKFGYYLNCLEGKQTWNRARIMPYSYLADKTPEEVRNSGYPAQIDNAGWHWSWLGGVDRIVEKFYSFSHQELNNDRYNDRNKLARKLESGQSLWTDDEADKWQFVDIDSSFPDHLVFNIQKFNHLIK